MVRWHVIQNAADCILPGALLSQYPSSIKSPKQLPLKYPIAFAIHVLAFELCKVWLAWFLGLTTFVKKGFCVGLASS